MMAEANKKRNLTTEAVILVVLLGVMYLIQNKIGTYPMRVIMLCLIYIIPSIGMNIIYGYTGMFSLGHYGFMTIGAYVAVILSLSPEQKAANYYVTPIVPWLANVELNYLVGILIGGVIAALVAVLIGYPVLKNLNDDYLGIATLGFAEIARIIITNLVSITNGPLGMKGLPNFINTYWCFGFALFSVLFVLRLRKVSFGRTLFAIRENEIAAEACGIDLVTSKVIAFALGAFFAGIGGALMGYWTATIDPKMFSQTQNFMILMIVVTGGRYNITGTVLMSFVITIGMEWLRFVEEPMNLFGLHVAGIPGTRMLIFSVALLIAMLRFKKGVLGSWEFSPEVFYKCPGFLKRKKEER
ncbi:MAG: branched-chain amino acid ABC transporter permease [Clostridium sp.]|nr:branched-chain amino acid ABC transporter permease [Clostridium sp.]